MPNIFNMLLQLILMILALAGQGVLSSPQTKLFVRSSFQEADIKSSTSLSLEPGQSSIYCAAICTHQGPESCQGYQRDPTSEAEGCKLFTFHPWATPDNGVDLQINCILEYVGTLGDPVPLTCENSEAQVISWDQLSAPTCSGSEHCQNLLQGKAVALVDDQTLQVQFEEYLIFDALEAVWLVGGDFSQPTRVKFRFDNADGLHDNNPCNRERNVDLDIPAGDLLPVKVDGANPDEGPFGGYCISIKIEEFEGEDSGKVAYLGQLNLIRGCTNTLGLILPSCSGTTPAVIDWSTVLMTDCEIENHEYQGDLCQDIKQGNPISLEEDKWLIVELDQSSPVTIDAIEVLWNIEGVGVGIVSEVKFEVIKQDGNNEDENVRISDKEQTVPLSRLVFDTDLVVKEIRVKAEKTSGSQVAILKEFRLIQGCND